MSLSNPTTTTNPASKFIEWKGGEGKFSFYNKETKENVDMPKEMYIIVLDQLVTITGFSEPDNSGIWSNEVKYSTTEELIVKTKSGEIAKGFYKDIKDKIKVSGGNFAKSVYACLIIPQEDGQKPKLELVNFKFAGSSLSPWIDVKATDDGSVIKLSTNDVELKKGASKYFAPNIQKLTPRQDILELAVSLDRDLQKYLTNKNSNILVEQEATTYYSDNVPATDIDDINIEEELDKISTQMPF